MVRPRFFFLIAILFLTACTTRQNVVLDLDVREMAKHYHESLIVTRRLATLKDEEDKLLKDGEIVQDDLDLFRFVYMIAKAYHIEEVSQQATLDAAWEAVRQEVRENGKVNEREFETYAIDGFLSSLDDYSHFYDFTTNYKDYDDLELGTAQFGALMTKVDAGLEIVALQREGIALKTGFRVGDVITSVNGTGLTSLKERDAVEKVVDFYNHSLDVHIYREPDQSLFLSVPRQTRRDVNALDWYLRENIAVIRLLSFDDGVAAEMAEVMEDIYDKTDEDLSGFILDFRANPGGNLIEAVEILDLFLPENIPLVTMVGQHENREIVSQDPDFSNGLPVVVLQDAGSASASELVAGSLKIHNRADIIGQKSYGKDVAQSLIALRNNRGAIILTTSRYFLPLDESVKGGLEPDHRVKDDPVKYGDEQLDAGLELIRQLSDNMKLLAGS